MNHCFGVKLSLVTASITLGVTALIANPVQAATITLLEDTFEAETLGLRKTDLTNWTTTRGNVDVIGQDASGNKAIILNQVTECTWIWVALLVAL